MSRLNNLYLFLNDEKGRTLPRAKLFFYENNSFDFKNTYADKALTSVNPNPVIADGAGRFPNIFLEADTYRVVLQDEDGVEISTKDDVDNLLSDGDNVSNTKVTTSTGSQTVAGALDDRVIRVGSVAESIAGLAYNVIADDVRLIARGWHAGSDKGFGIFDWDSSRPKADHDGAQVFSPTVPKLSDQAGATLRERRDNYLAGSGETDAAGNGCWIRQFNVLYLWDCGGFVDDTTDDSMALKTLMAYRGVKDVGDGTALFDTSLTGTMDHFGVLRGPGRDVGGLKKTGGSATAFNRKAGSSLELININANEISGHICTFAANASSRCSDLFPRIQNTANDGSLALEFEGDGGINFTSVGGVYHTRGAQGTYAAIKIITQDTDAVPRSFYGANGEGCTLFDFGGCNDMFVHGGYSNGLIFSLPTGNKLMLSNMRFGSLGGPITIDGGSHQFNGCVFAVPVILSGNNINLGDCIVPSGDITDNGSNNRYMSRRTYTVDWTADGTNPAIGDGVLQGRLHKDGYQSSVDIRLVIGSTTTLGTGEWFFSVPVEINEFQPAGLGSVLITDSGTGTKYTGVVVADRSTGLLRVYFDGSSTPISPAQPIAWATGDELLISIRYTQWS